MLTTPHFTSTLHTYTIPTQYTYTIHLLNTHCTCITDYLERRDLTKGLGVEQTWTDYCTGLEAALLFNSYTYTGELALICYVTHGLQCALL